MLRAPRACLCWIARRPVAVLFAASLGFGNAAYLYITVAFVQMLKAITPVAVLLCSFGFGLEQASMRLFIYICLIATGVAVACYGQLQLDWLGVGLQLAAVLAEALRLCLVNIALTARGIKLSSVTFLSVVAPLCAAVLLPAWLYLEYPGVSKHHWSPVRKVGFAVLFANASVAFLLNLSTMALIKHTSALTLNISGVFKDLGLIGWSVIVSGAVVTKLQYVGYAVALVGVTGYSAYKRAQQQKLSGTPITPADERASKRTAHRLSGTGGAKDEEQPLGVTDEEEDAPSRRAP